ncbi:MAG: phosphoglycerate kinase [SAR202 cluster bacterium]|nr:phosphoglycerate kinase [SAR202 cluster bacterium]
MNKKTVRDIKLDAKTVLVRVDYNVPFRPGTTEISDDSRIRATLPTLRYLIERKCRVVVISHMGRPKGKEVDELRMNPVTERLAKLLGSPVVQAKACVGPEVQQAIRSLPPGGVIMLENIRFMDGEEKNDPKLAADIAALGEVFVNDAFGAAHRAHASTEGVAHKLPSVAGFLMQRELDMLGTALESPKRPFTAIVGGAKVSDKSAVLEHLARNVDAIIIGGGMAATFLKAKGLSIGDSLVEDDRVASTAAFMQQTKGGKPALLLPTDVVVADAFAENANHKVVPVEGIQNGWRIMDIGPKTAETYERQVKASRTVLWNGPMGVFEWKPFAAGTERVAMALASLKDATTVLGGGSTAEAADALGLADRMTHVSTGGGASLEFLEGKTLPGVAALMDAH